MDNFTDVFRELNQMERDGTLQSYAIAGATAFLFYSEPVLTYDLDVAKLNCILAEHNMDLTKD